MPATIWGKFYWSDWSNDPALRVCSLAAQGLWMRLLCVAAEADPIGYVKINGRPLDGDDLARLSGASPTEVASLISELDRNGVFSRTRTGTIFSRRMVRDDKRREDGRKAAKNGPIPGSRRSRQATEDTRENLPPPRVVGGVAARPPPHPEARSQKPEDSSEAPSSTTRAAAGGSTPSHAARRQDLNFGWLEGLCRQAAGLENEGSPSLCDLSPIAAMLDRGFDLDRDVLPVLKAKAAAGKRGRSWRFYVPAIEENRHANAGVPIPIRPPPPSQVFVAVDTPEWHAWQALRRTPQITSDEHKRNGWWFPSQWPQPEGATA